MTRNKKRFIKNMMSCGVSRNDAMVIHEKLYLHKTKDYPFVDVLCTNLFAIEMAQEGKKNVLTNRGRARKKYNALANESAKRNSDMWKEASKMLDGAKPEVTENE